MATIKRLIFHLIGITHHGVTLFILNSIDYKGTRNPVMIDADENSMKYFTIWSFIFQLIYMICALVCDIGDFTVTVWPKHDIIKKCEKIRDFTFHTIIFPFSCHAAVVFWVMYSYDRELVLPVELDKYIHPMLNHAIHTNVVLISLLEIVLGNAKYPKKTIKQRFLWLAALAGFYHSMIAYDYSLTGKWIYKFLAICVTWTEIFLLWGSGFLSIFSIFTFGIYLQEYFNKFVNVKKIYESNGAKFAAKKKTK